MLQDISVRFDPVEDRLVLRLAVLEGEVRRTHWLHLTRRLCAAWRRDLQSLVDLSAGLPQRMDKAARAAVSAANHEVQSSQVRTRTEPAAAQPQPADPAALVLGIQCGRRKSDQRWVLRFELKDRPSLALVLSDPTLHALVDAVARRLQVSDWALPALPGERQPRTPDPATPLH